MCNVPDGVLRLSSLALTDSVLTETDVIPSSLPFVELIILLSTRQDSNRFPIKIEHKYNTNKLTQKKMIMITNRYLKDIMQDTKNIFLQNNLGC